MTDRVQELRERLEQIRVRAEKSTPEPWHAHGKPHPEAVRLRKEAAGVSSAECLIYLSSRDYVCLPETFARQQADAEFIAHARQDVPWLLGQIDALLRAASSCLVPRTPACPLCSCDDGLVREWVQKAREVARSKGLLIPRTPEEEQTKEKTDSLQR
jgi:hypothetical protein